VVACLQILLSLRIPVWSAHSLSDGDGILPLPSYRHTCLFQELTLLPCCHWDCHSSTTRRCLPFAMCPLGVLGLHCGDSLTTRNGGGIVSYPLLMTSDNLPRILQTTLSDTIGAVRGLPLNHDQCLTSPW
jgi:hypothetical protein